MRGEFLDLNVFARKFHINKSLCFPCMFWFQFIFAEVLSNFCDISNRIASL